MLVHRRVTPSIKFAGTHLYTWVERDTVRVKCLAQEHNTMSPARARTRTARSGDECTNHEATAPPTSRETDNVTTCTANTCFSSSGHIYTCPENQNKTIVISFYQNHDTCSLLVRDVTLEKLSLPILTIYTHVISGESWNLMTQDKIQTTSTNLV